MTPPGKAEDRFIQRYFGPLADETDSLGLKDDAAQITVPAGMSMVVSTDTIIAGIHFFDRDPPESIARKAMRVNVSDLVAKGSAPQAYVLSLALPEHLLQSDNWMSRFAGALEEDQKVLGLRIIGGDTVMTAGASAITVCAFGLVPEGRMVKRSGAGVGDRVYVTGTIGDSAIGLWARKASLSGPEALGEQERTLLAALSPEACASLELSYLEPPTNVPASAPLLKYASASMDISDGLSGDAEILAAASGLGLDMVMDDIPHHPFLVPHLNRQGLRSRLLTGGDDYQVLCTVPLPHCDLFEADMENAKVSVSCIGKVVDTGGVRFLGKDGQPVSLDERAYDHFS